MKLSSSEQEQVGYGGDFVYDKAIGHEIKWKEDKDLTKKVEIKKQRNKCTSSFPPLRFFCQRYISYRPNASCPKSRPHRFIFHLLQAPSTSEA